MTDASRHDSFCTRDLICGTACCRSRRTASVKGSLSESSPRCSFPHRPIPPPTLSSIFYTMFVDRELFGGAITARTAPDLIDASFVHQKECLRRNANALYLRDVRQVPDTQEVFMYPNSSVSIILEILQKVEPSQLDEAIRYNLSRAHA